MPSNKHPLRGLHVGRATPPKAATRSVPGKDGKPATVRVPTDKLQGLAPTNHPQPMTEPTIQLGQGSLKMRGAKPKGKVLPKLVKTGDAATDPAATPTGDGDAPPAGATVEHGGSTPEQSTDAAAGQGSADADAHGDQQVPPGDRDGAAEQRRADEPGGDAGHDAAG